MCDGSILQCTISSSFDTVIKYMTFSHYAIPPSQKKQKQKTDHHASFLLPATVNPSALKDERKSAIN